MAHPTKVRRTCLTCGVQLVQSAHHARRYCSKSCKWKADSIRRATYRKQYLREWQHRNADYLAAWHAAYRARNREVLKAKNRACYRNNPVSYQNARDIRRVNIRQSVQAAYVSERDWRRLLIRYHNSCAYCGASGRIERDHVVPIARGGRHSVGNLLPACYDCNRSKGYKFLSEWRYRR